MNKIVAIIGEPCTGKSTLVKAFMKQVIDFIPMVPAPLLPSYYSPMHNLYVFGVYDENETFGGTDRFSMSCQPRAEEFVKTADANILFEGDRLCNQSFLELICDLPNTETKIILLHANPETLKARHVFRNDTQSKQFQTSRDTKISRLAANFELRPFIEEVMNSNEDQQKLILNLLKKELL